MVKFEQLPTQIASLDEAEVVEGLGDAVGSSSKISIASNFVTNLVAAGSL